MVLKVQVMPPGCLLMRSELNNSNMWPGLNGPRRCTMYYRNSNTTSTLQETTKGAKPDAGPSSTVTTS